MVERPVEVIAYSGYRGEERPRSFTLNGKRVEVREVLVQWVEEDAMTRDRTRCFRVRGDDFRTHTLRYREGDGAWLMEGDEDNG